jgi:hypothetical protein
LEVGASAFHHIGRNSKQTNEMQRFPRGKKQLKSLPNNFSMDSAGNAVLKLQVHLRDGIIGEDGSVGDISCKTRKGEQ